MNPGGKKESWFPWGGQGWHPSVGFYLILEDEMCQAGNKEKKKLKTKIEPNKVK